MSHSIETDITSYSEIASLANRIGSSLPLVRRDIAKAARPIRPLSIELCVPDQGALSTDLSALLFSDFRQDALINMFLRLLSALQRYYEGEYQRVFATWQQEDLYQSAQDQAFRALLQRSFAARWQKMWSLVLDEVSKHTAQVTEADPPSNHDGETCYQAVTTKTVRGHDFDAVRILEQAFEHTPNITQAEKFQLAEATGLQPKQVTIWFQNRRNRKGKKGPKLAITSQSDSDPSTFKNESPPASPTRDFTLSKKKRKSYGALGRASLDSSSYDSDFPSSLPKKPRLPSAGSDVSDGSASSYEHRSAFTCWSTPSSRSNSSSLDSSGMSDFDSPRKPRNVFDYMKPRTLDVKAITSMPRLTISAPQQHASTNAFQGQRSPFLCDNANSDVTTGANPDFGGLKFSMDGIANDESFRESIQRVLSGMSGYEADVSRNVSSSSWASQQTTTDDDGWEDVDDSIAPQVNWGSQGQAPSVPAHDNALPSGIAAQAALSHRAQSALLVPTNCGLDTCSDNAHSQPSLFDNDSFDLSQFFQSASVPTHMPSMAMFPHQHGLLEVPLPVHNTQEFGEIEKPLDMDLDDIQSILDSNIFASSLPSSQQSNGGFASQDASVQGHNAVAGAEMGEGVFQMNFDLDSNSFGFV